MSILKILYKYLNSRNLVGKIIKCNSRRKIVCTSSDGNKSSKKRMDKILDNWMVRADKNIGTV